MRKIDKFISACLRIKENISVALLLCMLGITFVQVVLRYVFNSPFTWSEEVTLLMLVWFGFLTIAMQVKTDEHVSIEVLYRHFGARTKFIFDIVRNIGIGVIATFMMRYGWQLFMMNLPKKLPASGISVGFLYLPLFIGGVFIVTYSIINIIEIWIKRSQEKEVR